MEKFPTLETAEASKRERKSDKGCFETLWDCVVTTVYLNN